MYHDSYKRHKYMNKKNHVVLGFKYTKSKYPWKNHMAY